MMNFHEHHKQLPETAGWLSDLRRQALQRLETLGFPDTRDEAWKYTNIKPLLRKPFHWQPQTRQLDATGLRTLRIPALNAYQLIFIDGLFYHANTDTLSGVTFGSLASAIQQKKPVADHLRRFAESAPRGFATLNAAFIHDGAFIQIDKNTVLEKPLHLLFISSNETVNYPHNLILLGENAQACVIEDYACVDTEHYFSNAVSQIYLQNGARLNHIKIQQEQENAFHMATTQVRQEKDSAFTSHLFNLGASLARNEIHVDLTATGATCRLNGLYLCRGRQHMDHYTRIEHQQPYGSSHEYYKGVIADFSRAVFNGQVYVHPGAHHTESHQSNKNLLLSSKAEIDAKPQLEIYNDDVKCTHGATVGQLDENELFYLRSRGMSKTQAESILSYAFAAEIIRLIQSVPIQAYLRDRILQRLPAGPAIQELFA